MQRGGLLDRKDGSVSTKLFQGESEDAAEEGKAKTQPLIDGKTRDQFLDVVKNDTAAQEQDAVIERRIRRKQSQPHKDAKCFDNEKERMGIKNSVDLVLGDIDAEDKYRKNLINDSQDEKENKKEKEVKYMTIGGLLKHHYFMSINEADISVVIDEFEKL